MTFQDKTKNQLAVAAIFAAGWFAFLMIASAAGVDIDFASSNLMMIWICYFTLVSIIASIFLMQPKWIVQKLHIYLLICVVCVGIIGAIKFYIYYGNIIPNMIFACAFAVIGFLFAKVFDDRIKRRSEI